MVINILAMISLSFLIKEIDGPFDICLKIRTYLLHNKYVGVFFYKLFSCIYCCGFYSGIIVYNLQYNNLSFKEMILYGLVGSITSLFGIKILEKINE